MKIVNVSFTSNQLAIHKTNCLDRIFSYFVYLRNMVDKVQNSILDMEYNEIDRAVWSLETNISPHGGLLIAEKKMFSLSEIRNHCQRLLHSLQYTIR